MMPAKAPRKKPSARARKRAHTYSTSQGRAHFAEALETAQHENAVIGFDRYGHPVAALVSIDAVRVLAGQDKDVEPAVRAKIRRMASLFLRNAPAPEAIERVPAKAAPKRTTARSAAKKKSKRKGLGKGV